MPKNKIINYFVTEHNGKKEIFPYPFMISSSNFLNKLNEENKINVDRILHVCLDMLTNRLYLPEINSIEQTKEFKDLIDFAIYEIEMQNKNTEDPIIFPANAVIPGNPYTTLRIKKLSDFPSAINYLSRSVLKDNINTNLTIVEVNLNSVSLLKISNKDFKEEDVKSLMFDENKFSIVPFYFDKNLIATLKAPFLLINISPKSGVNETAKEMLVINAYRPYLAEKNKEQFDENKFSIQYELHIGWTIKDICTRLLTPETVGSVSGFMKNIGPSVIDSIGEFIKTNKTSPIKNVYYYYVKNTSGFPFRNVIPNPEISQTFDISSQHPTLQILYNDAKNNIVVMKSILFIPQSIYNIVFGTNQVTTMNYNIYENTISSDKIINYDVKQSSNETIKDIQNALKRTPVIEDQINKIKNQFIQRKISDFPYATEKIKDICNKLSTSTLQIPFDDFSVFVGPISKTLPGVAGGYLGVERFKQYGVKTFDSIPGMKIRPPAILIDTVTRPSVHDYYDTIIHEYRHHINTVLQIASPEYKMPGNDVKKMLIYLNSPDEITAHIQQAMYLLSLGMTKDQIIRRWMPVKDFDKETIKIAQRYSSFIDTAEKTLKEHSQRQEEDFNIDIIDPEIKK